MSRIFTCFGCDRPFTSTGAIGNHTKHAKDCTQLMRFWGKVQRSGDCWLWLGYKQPDGYGQVNVDGKTLNSHKHVYELFNGKVPSGMEILHSCDVRHCVNPAHMSIGTHTDNMRDAMRKGRNTKGELTKRNKITETQAREILSLKGNARAAELARKHGVKPGAITAIWRGDLWRHIHEQ